jgi:uncharacterized membrane protein
MNPILTLRSTRRLRLTGTSERSWLALAWAVLAVGLLFRIVHYLGNRSLWLDEAMLARNILDRGPLDLLRPLAHYQTAPVLVRLLMDAATVLFGPNELALRLVPLLASLASLWLCFRIGRIFFENRFLAVFMALVAFSYPLVYYAQEVKPYAIDVAVALALIYTFLRLMRSATVTTAHVALLGVGGSVAIGLSHTAALVLAGMGIPLLVLTARTKDRRVLGGLVGVFVLWVFTYGLQYWLCVYSPRSNRFLRPFYSGGFLPAPTSMGAITTWGVMLQSLLQYTGYPSPWTIFITALIAVAAVEAVRHRRLDSSIVILTIVATLAASALHQYPVIHAKAETWEVTYGKFILFLVPPLYLLIVRGLQTLTARGGPPVAWLLTALLLVPSLSSALTLFRPIVREEVRPVLHYLGEHRQPGDRVYVYYRDPHAVKYYEWSVKLPEQDVHWGKSSIRHQPQFSDEIAAMQRWTRVWFLFSHRYEDKETQFLSHLNGKLLDRYHAPGVSLYLYEFEPTAS